jgi:hypothetical protein
MWHRLQPVQPIERHKFQGLANAQVTKLDRHPEGRALCGPKDLNVQSLFALSRHAA